MTTLNTTLRPFTTEDFAHRMTSAAEHAAAAGLTGLLVTLGPDLLYFTGYEPIAITERVTMLVLQASHEPAMIVPILERPDAETAPGTPALSLSDWTANARPITSRTTRTTRTATRAISRKEPARLAGVRHLT